MFHDEDDLNRATSGIPGLDEMMEGGFPCPSVILLAGAAGTGKSTFCLQFLTQGAKNSESCLFFTTLSEPTQWMLRFASRYTFINKDYFGKEIKFVELGHFIQDNSNWSELLDCIEENIAEVMPSRIVIDPITIIKDMVPTDKYRGFLYGLTTRLKNWQTTTILTGEVLPKELYPVEISYIVDGVVLLTYKATSDGPTSKYLEILKMRGTNHITGKNLMNVSWDGISIQPGLR
jgi:circadian clock protein KaiC